MSIIQAGLNLGIGLGGAALGWTAARWGYPVIFQFSTAALLLAAYLVAWTTRPANTTSARDSALAGEAPFREVKEPG